MFQPLTLRLAAFVGLFVSSQAICPKLLQSLHEKLWVLKRPELVEPPVIDACKEKVELEVVPLLFTNPVDGEQVYTRSWNGMIPAPTITVKQGCTIDMTIKNTLGPPNPDCEEAAAANPNLPNRTGNWTCYLNTTNIHTHGLHTSPNAPGDSIFTRLEPGATGHWEFPIPPNHMAGTHWYHHLHHSTASQAGGGMAGALIVEDPKGSIPPYVAAMEEKVMLFFVIDFQLQRFQEYKGLGTFFWQTSPTYDSEILLVNGQLQPKITITSGKWYRLRMIFSAIEQLMQMDKRGTAWCATKLLSKDGVWLNVAPRDLRGVDRQSIPIQLGPGNRADVAVACTCPFPWLGCHTEFYSVANCTAEWIGENDSDTFVDIANHGGIPASAQVTWPDGPATVDWENCNVFSERRRRGCEGIPNSPMIQTWGPLPISQCGFGKRATHRRDGQVIEGPGVGHPSEDTLRGAGMDHGLLDIYNGTIFSLVVKPSRSPFRRFWHPAWKFSVRRPCYLVDTRQGVVETKNQRHVEYYGATYIEPVLGLKPGPNAGMWQEGLFVNIPNPAIDRPPDFNKRFQDPPIPAPYGNDYEIGVLAEWKIGGTAFHPVHLHISPFQIYNITGTQDGWFQDGDWQDVLLSIYSNCNNSGLPCPLIDQQERVGDGPPRSAGYSNIRFWTNDFTGRWISHCHLLTHEDEGMMFYFNVSGSDEGFYPTESKKLDPTCYQGYLNDEKPKWGYKWIWSGPLGAIKGQGSSLGSTGSKVRKLRGQRGRLAADTDESAYFQGDTHKHPPFEMEFYDDDDSVEAFVSDEL